MRPRVRQVARDARDASSPALQPLLDAAPTDEEPLLAFAAVCIKVLHDGYGEGKKFSGGTAEAEAAGRLAEEIARAMARFSARRAAAMERNRAGGVLGGGRRGVRRFGCPGFPRGFFEKCVLPFCGTQRLL